MMKKIPTIFKRNPDNLKGILNEHNPDCEWVFNGEGLATKKYDGSCCLVRDGKLYKRREIKKGKVAPDNFEIADFDKITGKTVGWVPVTEDKADEWHRQAFSVGLSYYDDGTYELCGPKVQGNPEGFTRHVLLPHSDAKVFNVERTYDKLKEFLKTRDIEGLVFHHPDGRMAKIKKRDFGLDR
jgi:hypothetical protein